VISKTLPPSEALRQFVIALSRPQKTAVVVATDLVGFAICAMMSTWLVVQNGAQPSLPLVIGTPLVTVALVWMRGLYRSVIRYVGLGLLGAGGITVAWAALVGAVIGLVTLPEIPVFRWAFAYWALAFIYLGGSRYSARVFLLRRHSEHVMEKVIIYGAGSAGAQLAVSLSGSDDFLPVAFIDDHPALVGKKVEGLTVHAAGEIGNLIEKTGAARILLAIPGTTRRRRRQVLEHLAEFPVRVQTVPDLKDIVSGEARVDEIKEVSVTDLLGRNPVPPNPDLLSACITGKCVMVTGAGGSIGSQLCYQILKQAPKRLVLFDISEPALYEVDRTLNQLARRKYGGCEIIPLLGSVHHEHRIREVMSTFSVQAVYHAAAYKHVPIVEQNLFEGIHNNVFGTLHSLRAAIDTGVESFVLISTDKAVNPASVMGATKRFAELIMQAHHSPNLPTRLSMVRFGNVLQSSGSVVPLFREQILSGGPVTVTHRDIIRYFMTIPEAAQLVIQAGAMARGGDIFVLDMGDPVKIRDLASRMIHLMGLTVRDEKNPDGDIEIQYTGLRPAEKLYEELLIGSNVSGTEHPRILRADEHGLSLDVVSQMLAELADACKALDHERAREVLLSAVREYEPTNGIDDLVWVNKTGTDTESRSDTVVDFPKKPG
jgi:FlaA1/EpsC-like NDP-sugar epimerase